MIVFVFWLPCGRARTWGSAIILVWCVHPITADGTAFNPWVTTQKQWHCMSISVAWFVLSCLLNLLVAGYPTPTHLPNPNPDPNPNHHCHHHRRHHCRYHGHQHHDHHNHGNLHVHNHHHVQPHHHGPCGLRRLAQSSRMPRAKLGTK